MHASRWDGIGVFDVCSYNFVQTREHYSPPKSRMQTTYAEYTWLGDCVCVCSDRANNSFLINRIMQVIWFSIFVWSTIRAASLRRAASDTHTFYHYNMQYGHIASYVMSFRWNNTSLMNMILYSEVCRVCVSVWGMRLTCIWFAARLRFYADALNVTHARRMVDKSEGVVSCEFCVSVDMLWFLEKLLAENND